MEAGGHSQHTRQRPTAGGPTGRPRQQQWELQHRTSINQALPSSPGAPGSSQCLARRRSAAMSAGRSSGGRRLQLLTARFNQLGDATSRASTEQEHASASRMLQERNAPPGDTSVRKSESERPGRPIIASSKQDTMRDARDEALQVVDEDECQCAKQAKAGGSHRPRLYTQRCAWLGCALAAMVRVGRAFARPLEVWMRVSAAPHHTRLVHGEPRNRNDGRKAVHQLGLLQSGGSSACMRIHSAHQPWRRHCAGGMHTYRPQAAESSIPAHCYRKPKDRSDLIGRRCKSRLRSLLRLVRCRNWPPTSPESVNQNGQRPHRGWLTSAASAPSRLSLMIPVEN